MAGIDSQRERGGGSVEVRKGEQGGDREKLFWDNGCMMQCADDRVLLSTVCEAGWPPWSHQTGLWTPGTLI